MAGRRARNAGQYALIDLDAIVNAQPTSDIVVRVCQALERETRIELATFSLEG